MKKELMYLIAAGLLLTSCNETDLLETPPNAASAQRVASVSTADYSVTLKKAMPPQSKKSSIYYMDSKTNNSTTNILKSLHYETIRLYNYRCCHSFSCLGM